MSRRWVCLRREFLIEVGGADAQPDDRIILPHYEIG